MKTRRLATILLALTALLSACKTAGTTGRQESLTAEAQGVADKLFEGYVVRCGDSYYGFKTEQGATSFAQLYEFKLFAPLAKKAEAPALSGAERLNREEELKGKNEPEPEWAGQIKVIVPASRRYIYSERKWGKWEDWPTSTIGTYSPIELKKVGGRWISHISENEKETVPQILERVYVKPDCADIPE